MEENTRVTTYKIENRAMEYLYSRMVESTKVSGSMASKTEKEYTERKISKDKEFGRTVKE